MLLAFLQPGPAARETLPGVAEAGGAGDLGGGAGVPPAAVTGGAGGGPDGGGPDGGGPDGGGPGVWKPTPGRHPHPAHHLTSISSG